MADPPTVRLRHGLQASGARQREAELRPLCGADELALEDVGPLPARRVTALLAGAVRRIGTLTPIGAEHVRGLTVGDRERLALALHAASFGPQVETVATCAACGTVAEMALDLREVLAATDSGPDVADGLAAGLRLPTGADQEAAAELAAVDPAAAEAALLRACLPGDACADDAARRGAREQALRDADPDADQAVSVACPGCGAGLRAVLDAHALLCGALRQRDAVLADVNRLAAAYHWSEADILALPTERRRRYLALLDGGAAA